MSLFFRKSKTVSEDEKLAFVELTRRNSGIINRICYYYATDADDFNDLRQDVLVSLWESRDAFRGESKESTWVYRLTLNTCISFFRQRKKRGVQVPIESLLNLEADESSILEQHRLLHKMIQQLNHRERAVLLPWLDGADYETISEVTGINRNTVATILRRTKEKLERMAD